LRVWVFNAPVGLETPHVFQWATVSTMVPAHRSPAVGHRIQWFSQFGSLAARQRPGAVRPQSQRTAEEFRPPARSHDAEPGGTVPKPRSSLRSRALSRSPEPLIHQKPI